MLSKFIILNLLLIFVTTVLGETQLSDEVAQISFEKGRFEQAVQQWQTILSTTEANTSKYVEILIKIAATYQELGLSQKGYHTLLRALPLAKNDALQKVTILANLSDLALATQQNSLARQYIDESIALLPKDAPALLKAKVLNYLGNVLTVEAYYDQAIDTYAQALSLAKQTDVPILIARLLLNMTQVHFKQGQFQAATTTLQQTWQILDKLPLSYAKVFNLLSIGDMAENIQYDANPLLSETSPSTELTLLAYQVLDDALKGAIALADQRLMSYSYGYLGHLYEHQRRYSEALRLTRQAIFSAQQIDAKDILFRWQWQLGRILSALAKLPDAPPRETAINAYRRAVDTLQPIRHELTIGFRNDSQSFRETMGTVYFELADLLLQQAQKEQNNAHWLLEAQQTIERFKTAELQDYFRDDCVTAAQTRQTILENNIAHTAILYPILLPDRSEILLTLPDQQIKQFSVPITASRLKNEVNEFRFELETEETNDYLPYAQRLYTWLIQPLETTLQAQQIDTLIIAPDGVLRTVPFAALHDGNQFLINKYAFVTVPSLTLTEPRANKNNYDSTILISGLSKSVRGYTELTNVANEVNTINQLYQNNATLLLDENFTENNFANALRSKNYSIVHIASHGQFESNPENTFLLTYDDKITMNRLEQLIRLSELRNEPMDLLTLSACQTAVGDDQAALGVAGIAIKAGARSALATLWFIDDRATTQLITEFYHQLRNNKLSKTKALQSAQKNLLKNSNYRHPIYWAPFLLIGN